MVLIFNDIAGSEVVLILVFILIFFGSKSIPGLAKSLGRTMRQIKDASAEIQQEIKKSGGDMKKDLNLGALLKETEEDIRRPLDQYTSDLDEAVRYESPKKPKATLTVPTDLPQDQVEPASKTPEQTEEL